MMKSQLADFVSIIFPRTCYSCGESLTTVEEHLCLKCLLELPRIPVIKARGDLIDKFSFENKVSYAHAFLRYNKGGIAQKIVQGIKYRNERKLGNWIGTLFGEELVKSNLFADTIIPVPIHRKRERKRGYNQSEIIANGISDATSIPLSTTTILRVMHKESQTTLSKLERLENMESVFRVEEISALKGKTVILFDDVITTGATMGLLCQNVAMYEPANIIVLSLAAGK